MASLGIFWLYFGTTQIKDSFESVKWPSVMGTVTQTKVSRVDGTTAAPKVTYEYFVNNVKYTNDTYFCGAWFTFTNTAERMVAKYRKGASVRVFYSPNDPNATCLQPGTFSVGSYMMVLGGVFIFIMIFRVDWSRSEPRAKGVVAK